MKPRSTNPCCSMDMISRVPVDQSAPGILGVSLMVMSVSGAGSSRTMPFSKSPSARGACVRFAKANATSGRRMPAKTRSPSRICRPAAMTISSRSVKPLTELVEHKRLGGRGGVGVLANGLLVDLDAQPWTLRYLDEPVSRLDGVGQERRLVYPSGKLH